MPSWLKALNQAAGRACLPRAASCALTSLQDAHACHRGSLVLTPARSWQRSQGCCGMREGCQRGALCCTHDAFAGQTQPTPLPGTLQVLNLSGRALEGQPRSSLGHVQASPCLLGAQIFWHGLQLRLRHHSKPCLPAAALHVACVHLNRRNLVPHWLAATVLLSSSVTLIGVNPGALATRAGLLMWV